MKKYIFKYDDITCCEECPLFYDFVYCKAVPDSVDDWRARQDEIKYTWDDGGRPVNCPLLEVVGPNYE